MQRRHFIQNLFWLTGGMLAGCSKKLNGSKSVSSVAKGRVTSNGKGIGDVVVSDGFNVVKTAANGQYSLPLSASSEHVFMSLPAGYAFPHEKHIARHYQVVGDNNKIDFELERLKTDDNKHQFVIWADPQVQNEQDINKLMTQSVPDLQRYLKSLPAETLIHGICVGDIVWDRLPFFSSYNKAIDDCGLPFFQVIGNHDMDYRKGADDTSDDTFKANYGPSYYSFNRGQLHYVVLDDVWYLGTEREYKGLISVEQLEWLKKDLAFVPADKVIVLCLHIPVHNAVENREALYEILKPYKVHIMSGHTHHNTNVIKDNVYEHVHGTVCGAWWTGPICGDGTPPGYAIYEANGTDLKWHYKSTGFESGHQISGSFQEKENGARELTANVWNWDPSWKVEWQLDGNHQGELPRVTDFDPLAVQLYKGEQLPASRPFVEPRRTEHMFRANIPSGAKQVKILATDRFGNNYQFIA